jgi:hypothetical protein
MIAQRPGSITRVYLIDRPYGEYMQCKKESVTTDFATVVLALWYETHPKCSSCTPTYFAFTVGTGFSKSQ